MHVGMILKSSFDERYFGFVKGEHQINIVNQL